jgi:hypothetical protein
VDRSANMRSFIERMHPKKAEKALCSPLPLHPCVESAKREPVPDRPQGAPHTLSKRRRKTSTADADTEQLSTRTGSCQGAIISLMSDDEGAEGSSTLIVPAPDRCRRTISGPAPSSSVSGHGGDDQREGWACPACTYSHRAQEQQYLLCAMCGTNRLAVPLL